MTLVGALRAHRAASQLRREARAYAQDASDASAHQLDRLNLAWAKSLQCSPWARELQARRKLPVRFESWEAYERIVPVQRKTDLREVVEGTIDTARGVIWRSTGGTTAEPLRFPVFKAEASATQLDIWLGRGRLGVTPEDRLFLIWGHAHLFGTGLKGAVARMRRQLTDRALGYTRWSAYDLSEADLRRAGDALAASRARYVIGYSSALDRFARANMDRAGEFRRLGLKVVIATAEGFPQADSREVIAACFGCPVVMEYGAVETGTMAYERLAGGYDVFWGRHRLEAVAGPGGETELVVTSLHVRALPLLRYAIGDLVEAPADATAPLTEFAAVRGRCNDVLTLPDGAVIHSEAFTHAVRDVRGVRAFQVVSRPGSLPLVRYEADAALPPSAMALVRERLARIDPILRETPFERTEKVAVSQAGKHRMVISEACP